MTREPANHALHLIAAAILFSRGMKVRKAAASGERGSFGRFTHLAMTTSRLAQFGASVAASWLGGIVGACLVWNFIYSIGSRVVTDEIHYRLYDSVTTWGGIAGVAVGLAIVLLLRRPAPGVLAAGHAFATIAGFFGGSVGWQEGLCAYFGALAAFVICVVSRALFHSLSHKEHPHNAA